MLRSYNVRLDLWGGDKIVIETVKANDPNKAKQKARDAIAQRTKIPYGMIQVLSVEIAK